MRNSIIYTSTLGTAFLLLISLMIGFSSASARANASMQIGNKKAKTTSFVSSTQQLKQGQELYEWSCAVCHGVNGGGFAEARRAFPADHQRCERCHKPHNPRQMTLAQMTAHNAFSIGEAPLLVGTNALQGFSNALILQSYIQATMPRYEPNRHSPEEYLSITAYILKLRGELPDNAVLSFDNAANIGLH